MCGIAGIVFYGRQGRVDPHQLEELRDAQRHRGPDDAGIWIADHGRAGFAHRRLSIVDLSPRGHQPMATEDGRLQLVFNGEIYNFALLRRELEARGHLFRSSTDTEVILLGYREWGIEILDRLRGMYAFALYDTEQRKTLLVRDPLGIKPLYIADDGGRLVFAAEVQAIRRVIGAGEMDAEGLADYLLWGSIAPPRTLYAEIRALPPASWMLFSQGGADGPVVYYSPEAELGRPDTPDPLEAQTLLRNAVADSVRHHLVSDVPVGAFLSGGVDSSALVGLIARIHDGPVRTVTLSFDLPELDEGALAAEAARLYGADHHEVKIGIDEVRERIPDAIRGLDQPSIDGINTYFVSEAAVRVGLKVAVSGIGGDELFGGYGTFSHIPRIRAIHDGLTSMPGANGLVRVAARVLRHLPRTREWGKLARALEYGGSDPGAYFAERGLFSQHEVRALLAPTVREAADACDPRDELEARVRLKDLPPEERVSALEIRQYLQAQLLRDSDATSMR
ncbi:MAG TPA: asparagine synthase (glutamine-hydrolyzing), partial [Methanomassiliicoccales archaeon]|nr:asparagine synthase (glutamine-hydrolyzing) [Methanomassiliicoccales archaeon]